MGNCIDRYISEVDRSAEEDSYLHRATWMQLLNLVHPQILGVDGWITGSSYWAVNLRHAMTPFGVSYDVEGRYASPKGDYSAAIRSGVSQKGYLPTIELERHRVALGRHEIDLFAELWLQPEELLFTATKSQAGGAMALQLRTPVIGQWFWQNRLAAKSAGFQYGELYLEPKLSFQTGVLFRWLVN